MSSVEKKVDALMEYIIHQEKKPEMFVGVGDFVFIIEIWIFSIISLLILYFVSGKNLIFVKLIFKINSIMTIIIRIYIVLFIFSMLYYLYKFTKWKKKKEEILESRWK